MQRKGKFDNGLRSKSKDLLGHSTVLVNLVQMASLGCGVEF